MIIFITSPVSIISETHAANICRTNPDGYSDLSSLWHDLHPVLLVALSLPSKLPATQYILRINGDFHEYMAAWPESNKNEMEGYLKEFDNAWVALLTRRDGDSVGPTGTDMVRIRNMLRDGKERAQKMGVTMVEGVTEVYERALDALEGGSGETNEL